MMSPRQRLELNQTAVRALMEGDMETFAMAVTYLHAAIAADDQAERQAKETHENAT